MLEVDEVVAVAMTHRGCRGVITPSRFRWRTCQSELLCSPAIAVDTEMAELLRGMPIGLRPRDRRDAATRKVMSFG